MSTYLEMVDAIGSYYGTGSDIWQKVATSGAANLTPEEISAIRQVPGVSVTVTKSGSFAGWDFENPFPSSNNPAANVNSNVPNSSYGNSSFNGRVNGTYHWDGQTQTARLTSGARNVSTGARVATVAGKLNTAMTAVAAGMFLGAKIDQSLYNIGNFFNLHPPETLNPETWDSLASTEAGKDLIRHLFHTGNNGETTAYMPEDVIEYMWEYWHGLGVWADASKSLDGTVSGSGYTEFTSLQNPGSPVYTKPFFYIDVTSYEYVRTDASPPRRYVLTFNHPVYIVRVSSSIIYISEYSGTTMDYVSYRLDTGDVYNSGTRNLNTSVHPLDDSSVTIYSYQEVYHGQPDGVPAVSGNVTGTPQTNPLTQDAYYIIKNGNFITGGVPGASPDPQATQPGTIDPTQPILPQLKQNMPQVFNNPIQETVPQPDGTNKTITYYPVPWPKVTDDTEKPTSGTRDQADPTVTPDDPTDETSPLVDVITNPNPQPTTPTPGEPATPPDTGSGSSPTVVTPTGNASSLWAIYNPTQAQLDAFGAWLWSSDFVEQIKKLFNDPMQAIVGVHKVFATPPTGGQVNIKCGYIDSGCPAAQVTGQYMTVNCGTVNVREYYGNVFDYSPYTEISLYLPFIGIVKLDVADVMRGKVSVIYHVDVITGACLADVKISRDGENSVMYQYSGSAIVTYPISSGSYANMVTGVLSLAAGVAGTIMTGGAAAPALIGGAVGLSHLHTDVQKSGGFSGSPGAMGCKKPYLIISRAQDANPADFEKYEGKPASKTVRLGYCSGFVKVKVINIDNVPATYGELDQIVALLKNGVIL